jgi:hypothetical protein
MRAVQIKPQAAFANGKRMVATQFNVVSISDNLFDAVTFKYTLFDENMVWAGESTYSLEGRETYLTWDASPEGAYTIVAAGIGLEIASTVNKNSMFAEAV